MGTLACRRLAVAALNGSRPTSGYLVIAFKLLVVPALLAALAWKVADDTKVKVPGLDPWVLVAALAVNQLGLLWFALRMKLALRAFGIAVNAGQSIRVHLQSMFYFFALPMTVGLEVARFAKIRNAVGPSASAGALTFALVTDRVIGAAAAFLIALALLPFVGVDLVVRWSVAPTWTVALAAVVVGAAIAGAVRLLGTHLVRLKEAVRSAGRGLWLAFGVAVLTHIFFALGVHLAAVAAHVYIEFIQTVFFVSAAMLFVVLPVSFAGVSPVEAAGFGVLMAMGLPPKQAAILVIAAYLMKLVAAFEGAIWEIYEGGWQAVRMLSVRGKDAGEEIHAAAARASDIAGTQDLTSRTISDFGEQWVNYQENPGYYGSVNLLQDLFGPLLSLDDVKDASLADIGSGTGRIVNMLLDAGAARVFAVEPSAAFTVLQRNTESRKERVVYLNVRGDALPRNAAVDLVVSMGVLHHIPDPHPVVKAAYEALKPGGRMLAWIYGREGNELYLHIARPLRGITKRMPHFLLQPLCSTINLALDAYIVLCRVLPLPMRDYMRKVLARFPRSVRRLTIYDQLNPAYAKYYTRAEAHALLAHAGFVDVVIWHRHGYSWTVMGRKPE